MQQHTHDSNVAALAQLQALADAVPNPAPLEDPAVVHFGKRDVLADRLRAGDVPPHLAPLFELSRELAAHGATFMVTEAHLERHEDLTATERSALVVAVHHRPPGVNGDAHLPRIDVDDLFAGSPVVIEAVGAVAAASHSNPDLMALGALAAASAALARKVEIRLPDGFCTTANLHVVVEARSGRGKGPMTKRMGALGVLLKWQNNVLIPRHANACRLRQIDHDLVASDVKDKTSELQKVHRAGTDRAAEHRLKQELADLKTRLADMPVPTEPWFIINDTSPQRFVDMCHAAGFGMLCHGEGDVLLKAFTAKSDSDNMGPLLSSWSVEEQRRDRVGTAKDARVKDGLVAAAILLPLQPNNLAPTTAEAQAVLRDLNERGAFARWVVARPPVVAVSEGEDEDAVVSKVDTSRYDDLLVSLCESAIDLDPLRPLAPARPAPVVFDEDAGAAALKFQKRYKAKANPGCSMSGNGPAEIALKIGEQAFRIAAVIAALRVRSFGAEGYTITLDDWQRAVRFAENYVLPHVLACVERAGNTSVGADAMAIASTLAERGPMTKSALRRGPFKTWDVDKSNDRKSRFTAALDTALERGIVRAEQQGRPAGPGKDPKIMCYAVLGGAA